MAGTRHRARDRAMAWLADYCRACRWLALAWTAIALVLLSGRVHAGLW